jgi:hypothetical protein
MRPLEENDEMVSYCKKVLSGRIRHEWVDRDVTYIFPKYRLIKEIRANLFLKWFTNNFPSIPVLFIIRHPCAVVLSRMDYAWDTEQDISSFLAQEKLIQDFLSEKLDIISNAKTIEEKHAIIWCISNLIPLKHFTNRHLNIFFYENLCADPKKYLPEIFQLIKHQYNDSVFKDLSHPSITALPSSAIITGEDKIMRWKAKLSTEQVRRILDIVRAFELDYLYGDSVMPLLEEM